MGPAAAFLILLALHLQSNDALGQVIYEPEVVITPRVKYIDDCTTCTIYPSSGSHEGKVYVTDQFGRTSLSGSGGITKYAKTEFLPASVTGCTGNTCGQNAQCTIAGGRPVCSCFNGYTGDPLTYCRRAECLDNSECRGHLSCINEKCVNPCEGICGFNANCEVRNHVPVCSCPPGHTGDPFSSCRKFDPEELCHPSPCGSNTQCEVINNVPTCKCLPGYHGSPVAGCRHECESDSECGPQSACLEFRCQNPCSQCGENAECEGVRNHVAVCKCPRGYFGNPLISCKPECVSHSDCPPGKPACFYNQCKNPCDGVCGINANCQLKNGLTPVCSCPKDMTGNPFVSCRPFTKEDLCEPNPCGQNAKCTPGHDRYNKERPVCTCLPGYTGDPLRACIRGECLDDAECPDTRACINLSCQNPCINQCGINAMCNAKRHIAVCTCFPGYNGDALTQCHPVETAEPRIIHKCVTCNY
ncbi:adhesive plaque matrix protein 2 [Agrilus planipennis]|uniref:Adhesive plaque matrix protein 2 n=1 Tax=Agrilus planipennis TaxID=224129 RepID=A0A1W4WHU1_AGRPL|nr:adhesive plaque matrix protein 2 [Agrilus planipennis]